MASSKPTATKRFYYDVDADVECECDSSEPPAKQRCVDPCLLTRLPVELLMLIVHVLAVAGTMRDIARLALSCKSLWRHISDFMPVLRKRPGLNLTFYFLPFENVKEPGFKERMEAFDYREFREETRQKYTVASLNCLSKIYTKENIQYLIYIHYLFTDMGSLLPLFVMFVLVLQDNLNFKLDTLGVYLAEMCTVRETLVYAIMRIHNTVFGGNKALTPYNFNAKYITYTHSFILTGIVNCFRPREVFEAFKYKNMKCVASAILLYGSMKLLLPGRKIPGAIIFRRKGNVFSLGISTNTLNACSAQFLSNFLQQVDYSRLPANLRLVQQKGIKYAKHMVLLKEFAEAIPSIRVNVIAYVKECGRSVITLGSTIFALTNALANMQAYEENLDAISRDKVRTTAKLFRDLYEFRNYCSV